MSGKAMYILLVKNMTQIDEIIARINLNEVTALVTNVPFPVITVNIVQ